jgi:hypothetical protein
MNIKSTFPVWATMSVAIAGGAIGLSSQVPASVTSALSGPIRTATAAAAVAAVTPVTPPALALAAATGAKAKIALVSEDNLRAQIKFETVRWAGKPVQTLDEESRILLAQAAAAKAHLGEVGLSYKDVYGVIEAETSWIPRTGLGNNGVTSYGLAQFEPRTAKGLGLTRPDDPVQAVFAAAVNMKHGAKWASAKIEGLKLSPEEHAEKLREGVSIYYNLSVKGRNKWDGFNTAQLPIETQRHIRNVRAGITEAEQLALQMGA